MASDGSTRLTPDEQVWDDTLTRLSRERPEAHEALSAAYVWNPQRDTAGEIAKDILDALYAAGWELHRAPAPSPETHG